MAGQNQKIQEFSSKELDGLHALYKHITGIETCRKNDDLTVKINELLSMVRTFSKTPALENSIIPDIYLLVARHHMHRGEVVKSAHLCLEGLQNYPKDAELQLYHGHCLTCLRRFEEAHKILLEIKENNSHPTKPSQVPGLYTFRKHTALGELHQQWDNIREAESQFKCALDSCEDCVPAHRGLIELEIMKTNLSEAYQNLAVAIKICGPSPSLILTTANLALVSLKLEDADNTAASLKGSQLDDDRFEYLLFQIDFFKRDRESLISVPYMMTGESAETEAARIWLMKLRGKEYRNDPFRIPENVWQDEYRTLDQIWKDIASQ